jgi:hypothetical protein
MKTLFIVGCAFIGWWSSRGWGLVGQFGLTVVCTMIGTLLIALVGLFRALNSGRHMSRTATSRPWRADDEAEQAQPPIDWVPLQGSPEDPLRNPWHAPDHQNPIDPNRWL